MSVEFTIEDNTPQLLAELERKKPELLNAWGNELYKAIYDAMTVDKVVDTGRLRGSISYSTPYDNYKNPTPANQSDDFIQGVREDNTVVYGSNVEYASYVNSGTSKQRARKFIENGTSRARPQLESVAKKILKGE